MILKESIDQIFDAVRIEDIIGDYVNLKRAGSNLKGLSPFSDEKTPSFVVSPAKQIWKDFSSGKGGNVVSFLMELEQYSYPEALRYLAKRYHITLAEDIRISDDDQIKNAQRESLYLLNDTAKTYFKQQLWEAEEGLAIGKSYFKERGFSDDTIQKFELGYAPDQWRSFTDYALARAYQLEALESTGLSIVKEDKVFDRFKGRVIFPIHSFSGRILGFGGRILSNNDKAAKYLNSPESTIYHKGKILYGIFHAKQSIIREKNCYLVEGYTDVISLYQKGISNVVASSGTALTEDQIRLLKRLTDTITLLYDGDAAGIKASFRNIDLLLGQQIDVRVILFPEGHDPDSYAKTQTEENFKLFLQTASTDFISFKTEIFLEEIQKNPAQKSSFIRDIVSSIAKIDNLIKREVYVRQTASKFSIREETLFNEIAQLLNRAKSTPKTTPKPSIGIQPKEIEVDPIYEVENHLIKLLISHGDQLINLTQYDSDNHTLSYENTVAQEIVQQLENDELSLLTSNMNNIYQSIKEGIQLNEIRTGHFFFHLMDETIDQLISTHLTEKHTLHNWKKRGVFVPDKYQNLSREVTDTLYRYKLLRVMVMERELASNLPSDEAELSEKLSQIVRMQELRKQLSQKLNSPI